jgi:hypothetical protein
MSLSFLGGVVITYVDFPLGMLNEKLYGKIGQRFLKSI